MMKNKFRILVSSCDKYSYIWDVLEFSHKNYLGSDYKDYTDLITETKKSNYFNTMNYSGKWKDMILSYLTNIDTDYILYLQDDYIFWKNIIPFDYFDYLVDICNQKDIDHLLLTNKSDLYKPTFIENTKYGELYKREYNGDYLASLQMGIWKKTYMIDLINKINPNSIWDFELSANKFCIDMKAKLYLFYNIKDNISRVYEPSEIVRKGQVLDNIKKGGEINNKFINDYPLFNIEI